MQNELIHQSITDSMAGYFLKLSNFICVVFGVVLLLLSIFRFTFQMNWLGIFTPWPSSCVSGNVWDVEEALLVFTLSLFNSVVEFEEISINWKSSITVLAFPCPLREVSNVKVLRINTPTFNGQCAAVRGCPLYIITLSDNEWNVVHAGFSSLSSFLFAHLIIYASTIERLPLWNAVHASRNFLFKQTAIQGEKEKRLNEAIN